MTIQYVIGNTFPHREALKAAGWTWARPDDKDASGKYVHQGRWVRVPTDNSPYSDLSPLELDYNYDEATAYELRVLAGEPQATPAVPPAPAVVDQDGNAAADAPSLTEDEMCTWSDQTLNYAKRWLAANVPDDRTTRGEHPRFDTGKLKKDEKAARLWECYLSSDLRAAYAAWQAETPVTAPVAAVRGGGAVAPAPIAEDSDVARRLRELFEAAGLQGPAAAAAPVDTETVRGIVAEMIADLARPNVVQVTKAGWSGPVVTGAHPILAKVLALVGQGVNVMLVGPAGCGKTHLAGQVAEALGRGFGSLSCTAGVTESALTGRLLPMRAGGAFAYLPSPFVEAYTTGGVFLWDEVDAADPNLLLVVNAALANGHMEIEQRVAGAVDGTVLMTRIERHPDFVGLAAANTFGTGATAQYVGRGKLDAAFLDRFAILEMTYDAAFEASLFGATAPVVRAWEATPVATRAAARVDAGKWVLSLRAKVAAAGISRVVSTRALQKALAAIDAGLSLAETQEMILAGWSVDERSRADQVAR